MNWALKDGYDQNKEKQGGGRLVPGGSAVKGPEVVKCGPHTETLTHPLYEDNMYLLSSR